MIAINDSTEVQIDPKYLDIRIIEDKILELSIKYVEACSWLKGYPEVVAKNDPEKDGKNLEELATQKKNVESNISLICQKIDFFNSLKDAKQNG